MSILQNVKGHEDLLRLSPQEQTRLCQEIRSFLVDSVSKTGGHLASNLGVVELSVAIETVYNTNIDRLVFDVGHQSYVHKLLTGRQADFARLRQFGGIAGFPKPAIWRYCGFPQTQREQYRCFCGRTRLQLRVCGAGYGQSQNPLR